MFFKRAIPTVVGYAKDTLVSGILEDNKTVFFGAEALANRMHLNLAYPLKDGVVSDLQASKDFIDHLHQQLNGGSKLKIKAVIGMPATMDVQARETMQKIVGGIFESIMLVPEPFLAAMGYRNEKRLKEAGYMDPVKHSLFIDIGAGTTDLCLIKGCYPMAEDMISTNFAGDRVDQLLLESIQKQYPEVSLPLHEFRAIKEQFSYVGPLEGPIEVKVLLGGKARKIDVGPSIGQACDKLLQAIFKHTMELIHRAPSEAVENILKNIVITGGGSRIKNLASRLQALLVQEGFEDPRVSAIGEHYKAFVGVGAWKLGAVARPDQWQRLIRN